MNALTPKRPAGSRFVAADDCEADSGRWLAQPVNALSSLASAVAGALIWRRSSGDPALRSFAVTVTANAVGGLAYHGPGGRVGVWLHDAALLWTLGSVAAIDGAALTGRRPAWLSAAIAGAAGAAVLAVRPASSGPLQAGVGVAVAAGEAAVGLRRLRPVLGPAALLGLGAAMHARSRTGCPWCRPDSLLQGHAAWHLLSSAALAWWGINRTAGPRH